MAFFKAVGVSPVHIDWAELFEAMRKGVVDGQENPIAIISSNKLWEAGQKNFFFHRPCLLSGPLADDPQEV
jgi:TRAP-type C4-dicarboxylate transport system substrate-binding protein